MNVYIITSMIMDISGVGSQTDDLHFTIEEALKDFKSHEDSKGTYEEYAEAEVSLCIAEVEDGSTNEAIEEALFDEELKLLLIKRIA